MAMSDSALSWRWLTVAISVASVWQPMTYAIFYAADLRLNHQDGLGNQWPEALLLGWSLIVVFATIWGIWRSSWCVLHHVGPFISALIFGHIVWGGAALEFSAVFVLSNVTPFLTSMVMTIAAGQAAREAREESG